MKTINKTEQTKISMGNVYKFRSSILFGMRLKKRHSNKYDFLTICLVIRKIYNMLSVIKIMILSILSLSVLKRL